MTPTIGLAVRKEALIGEKDARGDIRPASPAMRADPADPARGDVLTERHPDRPDHRRVQDNHPASHRTAPDLSPSPISTSTAAYFRLRRLQRQIATVMARHRVVL